MVSFSFNARSGHGRPGFVLLEVLLSLLILGIAVAAFMRSFTQSLSAARRIDVQTQAAFLAQRLLNQMEVTPPIEGKTSGGFGDEFKNFSYLVTLEYDEPKYGKLDGDDNIEQYFPVRNVEVEIDYDDKVHTPFQALKFKSALLGFEKFTFNSKQSYANY